MLNHRIGYGEHRKVCGNCGVALTPENCYRYKNGRFHTYCYPCHNAVSIAWYKRNPDAKAHYDRRRKFGLSTERYQQMVAAQSGRCAICNQRRRLHVDHDHRTGKVRALLCNRCNSALAALEDDLRPAMEAYLERYANQ